MYAFFCHITTGGFNFLHLQQPTSVKTANVTVNWSCQHIVYSVYSSYGYFPSKISINENNVAYQRESSGRKYTNPSISHSVSDPSGARNRSFQHWWRFCFTVRYHTLWPNPNLFTLIYANSLLYALSTCDPTYVAHHCSQTAHTITYISFLQQKKVFYCFFCWAYLHFLTILVTFRPGSQAGYTCISLVP